MIFAAAKCPPRSIATPVVVARDAAAPIEEQHLAVVHHVQGLTTLFRNGNHSEMEIGMLGRLLSIIG
jgi:hypothetical protein